MLQTEGIVFRQTRYRESSLILDIYTRSQGLLSFIVNGVYTKKDQRLASILQLMNVVDLLAYYQDHKNLHRIREVNLNIIYRKIPFDIRRSAVGIFMLEICRKSIKGFQANESLFDFIKNSFRLLDEEDSVPVLFPLHFLIALSDQLGFNPLNNYSSTNNCFDLLNGRFAQADPGNNHLMDPGESKMLALLLNPMSTNSIQADIESRRKLLTHLLNFYQLHLDHFKDIKSVEVFKEIF